MSDTIKDDLTRDHSGLSDGAAARRYFAKFEAITAHLPRVAGEMERDGRLTKSEVRVLGQYLGGLALTFRALSTKYLMTGRDVGSFFGSLAIDRSESGFPVAQELLSMANDAQQLHRHLSGPDVATLKEHLIEQVIAEQVIPTKLQYAISQRQYYESLAGGQLFWARNDAQIERTGASSDHRRYLIHWAVYDSQQNVPVIYLMELEDSGRRALELDEERWPAVQSALMAQAISGLKLLTIAKGFDEDFGDLHPKRLRRLTVGPMYSGAFTTQTGAMQQVLRAANAPQGEDWALAWALETLTSQDVTTVKTGWLSREQREIFALDPFGGRGAETGTTMLERGLIVPERIYQALAEDKPAGFQDVRIYVVGAQGRVVPGR